MNQYTLASTYPYPLREIEPVYLKCLPIWGDIAYFKCKEIIEFAYEAKISLRESFELQTEIDLNLK